MTCMYTWVRVRVRVTVRVAVTVTVRVTVKRTRCHISKPSPKWDTTTVKRTHAVA